MNRIVYKTVRGSEPLSEKELNYYGNEGWELASMMFAGSVYIYVFKKCWN